MAWRKINFIKLNDNYEITIYQKEIFFMVKIHNISTNNLVLLREFEFDGVFRKMKYFAEPDIKHPLFWQNEYTTYTITIESCNASFGNFIITDRRLGTIALNYDSVCSIILLHNGGFFDYYSRFRQ